MTSVEQALAAWGAYDRDDPFPLFARVRELGAVHARVEGSTRMKIRRLLRRMDLNAHDSEVWQGMLRQILWKLVS